ncbi:MAG: response regulator [Pseudomonadota bacterium]
MSTVNILIVDDNKNNLFSLRSLIEKYFENVQVIEANTGIVALSILLKKKVDLIFLDIQMPQMDGFETAKIIKTRQKTRHIPIVFLTAAYKSADFQKKGYDVGAVDYLTKPIDSDQLKDKIRTYLRLIEQTGQQTLHVQNEQNVQERIAGLVSEAKQSLQQEIVFKRQQIEYLSRELHTSLNLIISYNQVLETQASGLGYNELLAEIEKIGMESKHLLDLINKVLVTKLNEAGKESLIT